MDAGALEDRVIVIVGGTSGLGLSAAKAILKAGARGIVVTSHLRESADAALADLGSKARAVVGNASAPDHAAQAIATAVSEFGRVDGLYHVAGGSGRSAGDGPLHQIRDEAVDATLSLNLHSVIYSNRAAVNQFLTQKTGGAIVNVASVLAWSPSPTYFATHVYAAAKAGIIGLSKSVAAHYASANIRCNVLAPGLIQTPMSQRAAGDEKIMKFIATKQPLDGGRIGRPDDLDAAVVYLLSDVSRFVTGQVLAVDGGWTLSDGQVAP